MVSANTWHGGLPNDDDAPVLFGYLDRVTDINKADSQGAVGLVLDSDQEPEDYTTTVTWVRGSDGLSDTIKKLWTEL